jgi:hypothetical protein
MWPISNLSKQPLERIFFNGAMARNNYCKPHKITLTSWVEKALDQVLIKTNIITSF